MDIYTAKSQLQKILEFANTVVETKPHMYSKSIERWRELSEICTGLVHVIANIVQDEVLDAVDDSFESPTPSDVESLIVSLQKEIDSLKQFVNYADPTPALMPSKVSAAEKKISPTTRRSVISEYAKLFKTYSAKSTGYIEADECFQLIARWFDARFVKNGSQSGFKYNIRKIVPWIYSICIAYGKTLELGSDEVFIDEFVSWCDKLSTESIKYAVPYDIYQISSDLQEDDSNLTSVVIWDILMDFAFNVLAKRPDSYGLFVKDTGIYDMYQSVYPEVLNNYTYYKQNPRILTTLRIRSIQEGGEPSC